MNIILIIILCVVIAIIIAMLYSYLLLFLISNGKADLSFLFKGKTPTDGEISEKQKKEADLEWLRNKNPQSYYMTNSGGLKLHVLYLPATETTDRYILCIHGFHSRGEWEFASVSRFYHEHGFNVLMTDQRACGKSEGKYMTYGAKESLDVLEWIDFMTGKFGIGMKIVLHGVSMGSATIMQMFEGKMPVNVKIAILDCGYSSARKQLLYSIEQFGFPPKISYALYRFACLIHGVFDPAKVNPAKCMKQSIVPVLITHGDSDRTISCDMAREIYDSCESDEKKLLIVKGADHAQCFSKNDEMKTAILDIIGRCM